MIRTQREEGIEGLGRGSREGCVDVTGGEGGHEYQWHSSPQTDDPVRGVLLAVADWSVSLRCSLFLDLLLDSFALLSLSGSLQSFCLGNPSIMFFPPKYIYFFNQLLTNSKAAK